MLSNFRIPPVSLWRLSAAAGALAIAGALSLPALAQASHAGGILNIPQTDPQTYSSSASYTSDLNTNDLVGNELVSPLTPHLRGAAQYGGQYGNSRHSMFNPGFSRFAFEAGAGLESPIGNDTHGYETYGWNFNLGAGVNFSPRLGLLGEFGYKSNKIPGATLAQVGTSGGYIDDWSLTVDPIVYQPFSDSFGMYVTGGGGIYHKSTNFTQLEPVGYCDYFYFCSYGYAPVVVGHFSSNQGGLNAGLGFYWKAFGPDSNAKLYIESRYVWVDSPTPTTTRNGEGTEGLIPLTIGVRY